MRSIGHRVRPGLEVREGHDATEAREHFDDLLVRLTK